MLRGMEKAEICFRKESCLGLHFVMGLSAVSPFRWRLLKD